MFQEPITPVQGYGFIRGFIRCLALLATALVALGASAAHAQNYPAKPIHIILQYPVGGPSDILARIVLARLHEKLKQPIIIEPRVGAGGNIGTDVVSKATPDGYTLLMTASGPIAISPWLYKSLPYDPLKDLVPIVHVASVPLVLVTNKTMKVRNVGEFLDLLKANPDKYTYGSSGNGTPQHLSVALLENLAGVQAVHVPYKGQAPMAIDLIGGQVNFAIDSLIAANANIVSGRIQPLAVTSKKRAALLPDVPTLAESGVPGYESLAWYGVMAPAGTPKPIIERLNRELRYILDLPEVQQHLAKLGSYPVHGSPEQFGTFIKSEHAKWGAIMKRVGATVD